jgi:hypothetical protein
MNYPTIITKNGKMRFLPFLFCAFAALLISGCSSTRLHIDEQALAELRMKEPLLLFPPLVSNTKLNQISADLGKYYNIEVPKRVHGTVIYSTNIETLKQAQSWNNLIKNGAVNTMEAAAIAKSVGCNSVLTCQLMAINQYPPFRMVLNLIWIDADTGTIIGRLYQDVDLSDSETNYRFSNFVGQGPAKEVYEKLWYSQDLYQTAYLMPQEFFRFSAAYTTRALFGEVSSFPWWYFWRML